MDNLPALLPNVTALSKKRQRCTVINLENNFSISAKFTVIVSNNYPRISGKIGFTIEEKPILLEYYLRNGVNRQPIKRLHSKYNFVYTSR
jgi:hypothetical protein